MSDQDRVYLNVTTSWHWRRPPVGIVRVERELARYLRTSQLETRYCVLDASGREFVELTRTEVDNLLADGWCTTAGSVARHDAPSRPPGTRGVRSLVGRFVRRLPSAGVIYRQARRYVGARARRMKPAGSDGVRELSRRAVVSPGARDYFVSVGLDWEYGLEPILALKRRSGVTIILGCHDTIPVDFPEVSSKARNEVFQEYFLRLAQVADRIFAVSQTTKAHLEHLYRRSGLLEWPAIAALPLGCQEPGAARSGDGDPSDFEFRKRLEALRSGQGFVLYVSTIEARKNHRVLVQVWQDLYQQYGSDIPGLVFVGMIGWGVGDFMEELRCSEIYTRGLILVLDRVSDEELAVLYRTCLFSVFPSMCEGWGLGAVEAMSYGKVCVISSAPALVEATQGLCLSLHPFDFLGWRDVVTRYWKNPALRQAAESRMQETFSIRTWAAFGRDFELFLRKP